METVDNVVYLPVPVLLTSQQVEHWEETLVLADKAREYALRMLGRLPLEQGLSNA